MKIILSIIGLALIIMVWVFSAKLNLYETSDLEGTITIKVIDKLGNVIIEDTYQFKEEDTLTGLLEEHYETVWLSTFHGQMLLGIGSVITDSHRDFIEIRLDGKLMINGVDRVYQNERAPYGVSGLPLIDGNTYIFKYQTVASQGGN